LARAAAQTALLRLTQDGYHVGDHPTVEDLARQVDLALLVEELPPAPDDAR
jgi:hypothetical protein